MKSISVSLAVVGTALALAGSVEAPAPRSLPDLADAARMSSASVDVTAWGPEEHNAEL